MIAIKRAYEPASKTDGRRFLVDHLWPGGVRKDGLKVEAWPKSVSPNVELRQWFRHFPHRWTEFKRRYFAELDAKPEVWQPLLQAAQTDVITLVYSAQDTRRNNAAALKSYLDRKIARTREKPGREA